jgi:hypothetical protein
MNPKLVWFDDGRAPGPQRAGAIAACVSRERVHTMWSRSDSAAGNLIPSGELLHCGPLPACLAGPTTPDGAICAIPSRARGQHHRTFRSRLGRSGLRPACRRARPRVQVGDESKCDVQPWHRRCTEAEAAERLLGGAAVRIHPSPRGSPKEAGRYGPGPAAGAGEQPIAPPACRPTRVSEANYLALSPQGGARAAMVCGPTDRDACWSGPAVHRLKDSRLGPTRRWVAALRLGHNLNLP